MKQFLLPVLLCLVLLSCNNQGKQDEVKTDSTAKKEPLVYPYTAKYSLNWQPGDEKYAVLALTAMKKYSDGDVKGCFDYFADSIEFIADKYHFNGKKDSLQAIMTPMRSDLTSMTVIPDTWITTYYPDYKVTWVTLWSTEKWTDKKGKTDSLYVVDDIMIKNDKIAQIDEKQRMYPELPKKK
jgi:hypothetical protein